MRDDHAHVMQVKLCKANTRGVTGGSRPAGAPCSDDEDARGDEDDDE